MQKNSFELNTNEKQTVKSTLKKIKEKQFKTNLLLISFLDFEILLNKTELSLLKKFLKMNPMDYGFKGEKYGVTQVPKGVIILKNQTYSHKGKSKVLSAQYLPTKAYNAYQKLNQAILEDINKNLLIESGYRSPANQMIVFYWYLNFYKFDFGKTAKRVALPGYSQHGYPKEQAMDFMTEGGIPTDERPYDFAKTKEYKWLLKNAKKYKFYQSYPRNNKLGVMFEPWHWQYKNFLNGPSKKRF